MASPNKHAFAALDGMRGVAALCIVVRHAPGLFPYFHWTESFLAVDLFFCLSGFVLAHAYGARLDGELSGASFIAARLRRLYPLYLLGLVLGAIAAVAGMATNGLKAADIGTDIALGAVYLPNPLAQNLFPLNGPSWSLFFELAANAVMGFGWRLLSGRALYALCLACGVLLAVNTALVGNAEAGWGWPLWFGFLRVGFSFSAGIILYRLRSRAPLRIAPPVALIATVGLLVVSPPETWRAAYELTCILALFPLLILGASNVEPTARKPYLLLGEVSYPIYAIHRPLIGLMLVWGAFPVWMGWPLLVALIALCLVLARTFDPWARDILGRRRKAPAILVDPAA